MDDDYVLEELKKKYDELTSEETKVDEELKTLLKYQTHLESKIVGLHKILPNLHLIESDSKQLSSMISFTSTLAETVSSKVRQLDLAKSQVMLCMQRVEDILDLKFCTDGVQTALDNEDYEQAAVHVHRFLSLDESVLKDSAKDVEEGSTLKVSFGLLREAEKKLKVIINQKFDEALSDGDLASVERFFKIFPLLGQHVHGLKKFSVYLCSQIAETAKKNLQLAINRDTDDQRANVLYADTITLLFEGIARVIEIHQPLIETYYGPGYILLLMENLQKECDRQSKKVIDEFKKNRNLNQKFQKIQQYMMNPYKVTASEKLDPKDLDILLAEITLLNTRTELYLRFIRRRVTNDLEATSLDPKVKQERLLEIDQLITQCELSCSLQEIIGKYIMMEEYFMRESVFKAVNLDTTDTGSHTSSMVDDVFFIVKKCVRRALSSSSVDGVCAMINLVCNILETDYKDVLNSHIRSGFPSGILDLSKAYTVLQTSIQQGKLQSSDTDKDKIAYLITLNNIEISAEYVQTLKKSLEDEINIHLKQSSTQEKAKLESCLSELNNVSVKFKQMLDFGMSQLNANIIKPRIKSSVDMFTTVSHNITEEEFSYYEANDPFVQNFIVNLDVLLGSFKETLTSSNYDNLISLVTSEVTTQMEKIVFKSSFNRLGGIQLDKEVRALVGYFTTVTTWTIRDKFARLTQMATILNLETLEEITDCGPITWRLTPNEVRQVLALRTDFRAEDIRRMEI